MTTVGPRDFKVGDIVCYSAKFLHDTVQHTGDAPFDEGEVTSIEAPEWDPPWRLLDVKWKLRGQGRVLSCNVILKERRQFELL